MRTRFAPSPTGDLHLGGAYVALASWWMARRAMRQGEDGAFVLRIEDLDTPRVVAGAAERILDDLAWLGLDHDGEIVWQSRRTAAYEQALTRLQAAGVVYPCDCSRAEIAKAASAPHPGDETVYPGTCREKNPTRAMKRDPALRVRVPRGAASVVVVDDAVCGRFVQHLDRDVGDFVLRRGDGIFAYQLAVTVDDLASGITDVVRGADLLSSAPRQMWLASVIGGDGDSASYEKVASRQPWRTHHLPLVVDEHGMRLSKRTRGASVRTLRQAGIAREEIVGALAGALGLRGGIDTPCAPHELVAGADDRLLARESWRIVARFSAMER